MNKPEIATTYNPAIAEDKWYKYWMDNGFFKSTPDEREPYTMVIPPPNVTGVLHMGHMLNNTIQDILVRRARMLGKNACWVPGTDHASIATEAKVVAKLKEDGINKSGLTREKFMEHAWEWKEKHGGIILEQLKKLGASCDWDRTAFTMDKIYYESVIDTFIDLFNKGLIYRGVRMVNWDPVAQTAVSDEEVIHTEENSKLYYLRYKIEEQDEFVTIATTRPETILGDTAVCINPNDERFSHLKGKRVLVPLINRSIPIIEDDYVDMEFGTGCLKITPAHDLNDYEIGNRHGLESIDIFNDNGTLNEAAKLYIGVDRFEARKQILPDLEKAGNIVKIEDYNNKVGRSERTNAVIEPKLSMQWFLKMEELSKPALENVLNDTVKFHPAKFKNVYNHWMENIKDWCISRQLWWGQQIPAYYIGSTNDYVVAKTKNEALELAKAKTGNANLTADDLHRDDDVLDTWFSSWLWPIAVFDGIRNPDNEEINYYNPTNDLVTGHDIIFFWVARMIITGYEYRKTQPFKNVYFTGMVRDKQGRKMSKQLGNSPDPIKLMKQYGADGVRVGMLLCSPAGGDLLFEESLPEQGRNFSNKIWNAFRLVKNWEVDANIEQPASAKAGIEWFNAKLNQTIELLNDHFDKFRMSDALMTVYRLFWDDFSSWYLEIVKPAYQTPCDKTTYEATTAIFEKLLKLLHPFMPFITEELWHLIDNRDAEDCVMLAEWPKVEKYDTAKLLQFEDAKATISEIRTVRKNRNISYKEKLILMVNPGANGYYAKNNEVIIKMGGLTTIEKVDTKIDNSAAFMVKTSEFFIPLGDNIDVEAELEKLKADLKYQQGFLRSTMGKLGNEKFVNSAPTKVVEMERKKLADAQAKIKAIEEQISALKN